MPELTIRLDGDGAFEDLEDRIRHRGKIVRIAALDGGMESGLTMAQAIAETYAAQPTFYGATFCVHCKTHLPVGPEGEFVWEDGSKVGT